MTNNQNVNQFEANTALATAIDNTQKIVEGLVDSNPPDSSALEGVFESAPAPSFGNDGSPFLTQIEAANFLRLSPRTLERMRISGQGPPFVAAGRRRIYRIVDLQEWANERTFQSTSEVSLDMKEKK